MMKSRRFSSISRPTKIEVVPDYVKTLYRAKVDAHIEDLRSRTLGSGYGLSTARNRPTPRHGVARISHSQAGR